MTPICIAVTGTHSTGKTTLLRRLEMELRAAGRTVARTSGSLAARAAALGFPKLQQQTADTTAWIVSAGVCAELEAGLTAPVVLVDRSSLDPLAYFLAAAEARGEKPAAADVDRLRTLARAQAQAYTLLFATILDPAMPLGDHRDRDPHYRQAVDRHLHRLLAELRIPHQPVHNTAADQEAAIRTALAVSGCEAEA